MNGFREQEEGGALLVCPECPKENALTPIGLCPQPFDIVEASTSGLSFGFCCPNCQGKWTLNIGWDYEEDEVHINLVDM